MYLSHFSKIHSNGNARATSGTQGNLRYSLRPQIQYSIISHRSVECPLQWIRLDWSHYPRLWLEADKLQLPTATGIGKLRPASHGVGICAVCIANQRALSGLTSSSFLDFDHQAHLPSVLTNLKPEGFSLPEDNGSCHNVLQACDRGAAAEIFWEQQTESLSSRE